MAKNTKKRAIIYSNVKENKKLAEEKRRIKDNQINLNDEVIIGFNNKSKNEKKIQSSSSTKKSKKQNKTRSNKTNKGIQYAQNQQNEKNNTSKNKTINPLNKKRAIIAARAIVPIIILSIAVTIFLKSSVFNIKEINITVENNLVLTEAEIRTLSNISEGQNMFSINKGKAIENLKTNPYVESVKIKRSIPSKLSIQIVERKIKFQLESNEGEKAYIYVDGQGTVIDKSIDKKDCIIVTGYKTREINFGEKLNNEDLEGLSAVNLILQEAQNNEIRDKITKIDISNHYDYMIYFENDGKTAHLGNTASLNDKITRIKKILEVESEYQGEIFVNVDLNNGEYPYFRESV